MKFMTKNTEEKRGAKKSKNNERKQVSKVHIDIN
jgi:hypothetical protein